MRIVISEFDGNKIKVMYEDGTTKVLWRKQPGDETPPVNPVALVGLEKDEVECAIRIGFFRTAEDQWEILET